MLLREAVIQQGQLVLESPLPYPDGTRVQIQVEPGDFDPLLFLAENAVATGINDLAEHHDRYVNESSKGPG